MMNDILKLGDPPTDLIEELRRYGWSDEEILENMSDAIKCLNSRAMRLRETPDIPWVNSIACSQMSDCANGGVQNASES